MYPIVAPPRLRYNTMVNFQNSAVQAKEYRSFDLFIHILVGAYLWEYVRYISFDFQHLYESGGYTRWPKYIYFASRNVVLAHSILEIATYDFTHENNCQFVIKSGMVTLLLGVTLSSILIGIRVIAIWNKDTKMIISVIIALVIEFVSFIYTIHNVQLSPVLLR